MTVKLSSLEHQEKYQVYANSKNRTGSIEY